MAFAKSNTIHGLKRVFISGKITGQEESYKEKFEVAKVYLQGRGHTVMNPAILPLGFEHQDYLEICYKMIDACDAVVFLHDWDDSKGAKMEYDYADQTGKPAYLFDSLVFEDALDHLIDLREEKRSDMKGDLQLPDPDSVYIKDFIALDWALRKLKTL